MSQQIPDRGDIVWMPFDPQRGHEQAGRRPALVLSPAIYNQVAGLLICCPITSKSKGWRFEVPLPSRGKTQGVVLSDQLKSFDWRVREVDWIEQVDPTTIEAVLERARLLL